MGSSNVVLSDSLFHLFFPFVFSGAEERKKKKKKNLRGICVAKEFLDREENCFDFLYSSLFHCLVQNIFLAEKNELIFLDRENFNFL